MTSSQNLKAFLEETQLSKRELAHLVNVTPSYIYNLIDGRIPFTTKRDTLERLAVIMDIDPKEFEEYQGGPKINPYYVDNSARAKYLEYRAECSLSNLDIIRKVPSDLQLKVVDILRKENNIPPDITFIKMLLSLIYDEIDTFKVLTILKIAIINAFEQAGSILNRENMDMIDSMVLKVGNNEHS